MEKRHEERTQDITLLQDGGDEGATGANREAAMHVHAHHQHIFFLCLVCDQLLREGLADRKTCCTQKGPLDTEGLREGHNDGVRGQ